MEEQQMPPVREPKKKRRTGLIIFVVILIAILVIGGYFLSTWLMNKKVENIIDEGISQLELSSECRSVELQVQVTEIGTDGSQYDVTLTNNVDKNVGVKIVLINSLTNSQSNVLDFGSFLSAETKTESLDLTGNEVSGADKIDLTAYFLSNGEELICPSTTSFDI